MNHNEKSKTNDIDLNVTHGNCLCGSSPSYSCCMNYLSTNISFIDDRTYYEQINELNIKNHEYY